MKTLILNLGLTLSTLWLFACDAKNERRQTLLGVSHGNGGDFVYCREEPGATLQGLFAVDYLVTDVRRQKDSELVEFKDWHDYQSRLAKRLEQVEPKLAKEFIDYATTIGNRDLTKSRQWVEQELISNDIKTQVDIDDTVLDTVLPKNCLHPNSEQPFLLQAVIRHKLGQAKFSYKYDTILFTKKVLNFSGKEIAIDVPKEHALQQSFILNHEWLWDYFDTDSVIEFKRNTVKLRAVNRFLHSRTFFESDDLVLLRQTLNELMRLSSGFLDVCRRSPEVRSKIEQMQGKVCDDIRDLTKVGEVLSWSKAKITNLIAGDFSGFTQLQGLNLYDNTLSFLRAGAFDGLDNLKTLWLMGNSVEAIDGTVFSRLPALRYLNLSHNKITRLPRGLLADISKLRDVDLSHNNISEVPRLVDLLGEDPKICTLDFSFNPALTLPEDFCAEINQQPCERNLRKLEVFLQGTSVSKQQIEDFNKSCRNEFGQAYAIFTSTSSIPRLQLVQERRLAHDQGPHVSRKSYGRDAAILGNALWAFGLYAVEKASEGELTVKGNVVHCGVPRKVAGDAEFVSDHTCVFVRYPQSNAYIERNSGVIDFMRNVLYQNGAGSFINPSFGVDWIRLESFECDLTNEACSLLTMPSSG